MATILIVEDEEDLRLLLRLTLSGEPYTFLEAGTGALAWTCCTSWATRPQ